MWRVTMHVVRRLCFSGLLAFWLFLISEPLDNNTLLLVLSQILLDPQRSFLDNFLIEDLFKAILPFEQQLHIFNRISSLVANAVRHFGVAFTCAIWFLACLQSGYLASASAKVWPMLSAAGHIPALRQMQRLVRPLRCPDRQAHSPFVVWVLWGSQLLLTVSILS